VKNLKAALAVIAAVLLLAGCKSLSGDPLSVTTQPATTAPATTQPATTAPPTTQAPTTAPPTTQAPTQTPSPTPTVTVTPSGTACVTSAASGVCGPYTYAGNTTSNGYNTYVDNNCWADPGCKQTVTAYNPGDWSVSADEPAGNGSVETAPETGQQFNNWCPANNTWANLLPNGCSNQANTPISSMTELSSTYTESFPHNSQTIAQWAWDNWLSNDSGYPDEVMVWVDNNNRCNSGSYGTQQASPITVNGQEWTPYQYGSSEFIWSLGAPGQCAQQSSGTVDLLALLKWMQANGKAAAGATLGLTDAVWEICSTGGQPETFSVSKYTITAAA
jgi:hypothetical protein